MQRIDIHPYLLALCVGLLIPLLMQGQFTVYKTVDDLLNNTGTAYDGYEFVKKKGRNGFTIRNTSTKEKVEVDYEGIWGFSYKDRLYRVMQRGKYLSKGPEQLPALLYLHNGAFFWLIDWYMDGIAWAEKTGYNKNKVTVLSHLPGYITATIDGDAMVMSNGALNSKESKESAKAFFVDHPELSWLQECVENGEKHLYGYDYQKVERCMSEHEETDGGN